VLVSATIRTAGAAVLGADRVNFRLHLIGRQWRKIQGVETGHGLGESAAGCRRCTLIAAPQEVHEILDFRQALRGKGFQLFEQAFRGSAHWTPRGGLVHDVRGPVASAVSPIR